MTENAISALLAQCIADARAHGATIPLIGLAGAQGSGKTYHARAFAQAHPRVAHFSLDDVYLTRTERQDRVDEHLRPLPITEDQWKQHESDLSLDAYQRARAASAHLFLTRGPPGSHDLRLASGVVARLHTQNTTPLPRFDKQADDRAPESTWPVFEGPAEAVLIDGWCLGARPPSLDPLPINDVEREDVVNEWRGAAWAHLDYWYAHFFASFDEIVYLQAPSFENVRRWRGEQEEKMLGRPLTEAESAELDRFIQHYERITRAMLGGAHSAGWIVRLDEDRNVQSVERR